MGGLKVRHPLFNGLLKLHTRRALTRQGYSHDEASALVAMAGQAEIDRAEVDSDTTLPAEAVEGVVGVVAALGDGAILKALLDFLKSPQGQALIQALIAILLAMIGV